MHRLMLVIFLCHASSSLAANGFDTDAIIKADAAQVDTLRLVQIFGQRIEHSFNVNSNGYCDETCRTVDGEGGLRRWEFFDYDAAVLVILYPNYRGDYTVHFDITFAYAEKKRRPEQNSKTSLIMEGLLQEFFPKEPMKTNGPVEPQEMFHEFEFAGSELRYFAKGPSDFRAYMWPPGVPNWLDGTYDKMYRYTYIIKFKPDEGYRGDRFEELGVIRPKSSVNPSLSMPTHGRAD